MPNTLGGLSYHVYHPRRALRGENAFIQGFIHYLSLLSRQSFAVLGRPQASKTVPEYQHDGTQMQQMDVVYRRLQRYMTVSAKPDELEFTR